MVLQLILVVGQLWLLLNVIVAVLLLCIILLCLHLLQISSAVEYTSSTICPKGATGLGTPTTTVLDHRCMQIVVRL